MTPARKETPAFPPQDRVTWERWVILLPAVFWDSKAVPAPSLEETTVQTRSWAEGRCAAGTAATSCPPKDWEPQWPSAPPSPLSSSDAVLQAGQKHRFYPKRHLKKIQDRETEGCSRNWDHGTVHRASLLGNSGCFQTLPCLQCAPPLPMHRFMGFLFQNIPFAVEHLL